MGLYAPNGSIRINVVDGVSYTGLYSPDGEWNVFPATGTSFRGLYHPCGALQIGVPTTSGNKNRYTPEGYLKVSPSVGSGALFVDPGIPSGSELLLNGDFTTDTVWSKTPGATIAGGIATIVDPASGSVFQSVTLVAGGLYLVKYDVTAYTSGVMRAAFTGGTTVNGSNKTAVGSYQDFLIALTGNNSLRMLGGVTPNLSIDNVSLKRIQ